jgi:hypothetical protein
MNKDVGFQSVTDLQSITHQDKACHLCGYAHVSCLNLMVWLVSLECYHLFLFPQTASFICMKAFSLFNYRSIDEGNNICQQEVQKVGHEHDN